MTTNFRGDGYSAQIAPNRGGYMLTMRDGRGRLLRRRTFATQEAARSEMWRYSSRWKVA